MAKRGEVLVTIMNTVSDFILAQESHWCRIPVRSVEKWLKYRWPPQYVAFYHTKVFEKDAYSIVYYAQVIDIRRVYRWQLLPHESHHEKAEHLYYQVMLEPLKRLAQPIFSRRWRRIVFIPTTWDKLMHAVEINDLYDESPLEDRLWAEFKRINLYAERQEFVTAKGRNYALDFAIYCEDGKIDVETDGDAWHANRERAAQDNRRDNDLKTIGWRVLRFTTGQVQEETTTYCLETIVENINNLGGIKEEGFMPRKLRFEMQSVIYQPSLFDYRHVMREPDNNDR